MSVDLQALKSSKISFLQKSHSSLSASTSSIIVGVMKVAGGVLCAFLLDRLGRKFLLEISAAVMAVCLGKSRQKIVSDILEVIGLVIVVVIYKLAIS